MKVGAVSSRNPLDHERSVEAQYHLSVTKATAVTSLECQTRTASRQRCFGAGGAGGFRCAIAFEFATAVGRIEGRRS